MKFPLPQWRFHFFSGGPDLIFHALIFVGQLSFCMAGTRLTPSRVLFQPVLRSEVELCDLQREVPHLKLLSVIATVLLFVAYVYILLLNNNVLIFKHFNWRFENTFLMPNIIYCFPRLFSIGDNLKTHRSFIVLI